MPKKRRKKQTKWQGVAIPSVCVCARMRVCFTLPLSKVKELAVKAACRSALKHCKILCKALVSERLNLSEEQEVTRDSTLPKGTEVLLYIIKQRRV